MTPSRRHFLGGFLTWLAAWLWGSKATAAPKPRQAFSSVSESRNCVYTFDAQNRLIEFQQLPDELP